MKKLKKKDIIIGGIKFIHFEPRTFMMGHLKSNVDENPIEIARKVKLTEGFYMQSTPVTTQQYLAFLKESAYEHDYHIEIWDGKEWTVGPHFLDANSRGNDYPVVGVSFVDAENYIRWASKKFNKNFRLPTEAEFELAAKSGCRCQSKCHYAAIVGDSGIVREVNETSKKEPLSLRKAIKTTSGLIGMHGSVWQWCSDWFFNYDITDTINPQGPIAEPSYAPWKGEKWPPGKVIRGGSFSYPFNYSRCFNRHYSKIDDRNNNLGFRLCI